MKTAARMTFRTALLLITGMLLLAVPLGCGKKGPPVAPPLAGHARPAPSLNPAQW